jgi:hypothetical protein
MNEQLKTLIEEMKKAAFMPEYQATATDSQALGILISKFFEWDGVEIMKAFSSALEDANFHTENKIVARMIKRAEGTV